MSSCRFVAVTEPPEGSAQSSTSIPSEAVTISAPTVPETVVSTLLSTSSASHAANASGTGDTRKRGDISAAPSGFTPTQNVSGIDAGTVPDSAKYPSLSVARVTPVFVSAGDDAFSDE